MGKRIGKAIIFYAFLEVCDVKHIVRRAVIQGRKKLLDAFGFSQLPRPH
jgi:hypothetical protein